VCIFANLYIFEKTVMVFRLPLLYSIQKERLQKIIQKKCSVFDDSFVKTLEKTSSVKFYLDYGLFSYTKNICIKFLETLKNEEVALNNLYREHVEKNKQSIKNYLGLLEGDYPNNWIARQRFNIELLKVRGVDSKNVNMLEVVLGEKCKNISKKIIDNPNYITDEIQKAKLKLENISKSIKTFEDSLDAVTNKLFKKLNNIDKLKITNTYVTYDSIATNAIRSDLNNQPVGNITVDIYNSKVTASGKENCRFTRSLLKRKENLDKDSMLYIEEKYKMEQELYESYKKTTMLLLTRIQKHNSYVAIINLFIDYYNFIKIHNVDYVYFSTFGDFRGRIYYTSNVSPQANSLFRFLYYFGTRDSIPSIIIPGFVQKNTQLLQMFNNELLDIRLVHVLFSIGAFLRILLKWRSQLV